MGAALGLDVAARCDDDRRSAADVESSESRDASSYDVE